MVQSNNEGEEGGGTLEAGACTWDTAVHIHYHSKEQNARKNYHHKERPWRVVPNPSKEYDAEHGAWHIAPDVLRVRGTGDDGTLVDSHCGYDSARE